MHRWNQGDTVIIRNIARSDGTVTTAVPVITLEEDPTLLALYIPAGTHYKNNWNIPPEQRAESVNNITPSGQRRYQDLVMRTHSIRLYLPGKGYSIGLSFDAEDQFLSWYGNLEAPFIVTPIGIDTRDYALDIIAYPDGRWHWKDEEEFQRRLEVGIDSEAHQAQVRAAGQEFINRFERNAWPFNMGWQTWRPAERWLPRELPENWAVDYGTHQSLSDVTC